MKKLNYELKNLVDTNKDGSHSTQADRHRYLQLIASQLQKLGFKHMGKTSLKAKHIWSLVKHWQTEISAQTGKTISNGTIKNRMSALRWWASKVDKASVIPRTNKELGIEDRARLPVQDKAFSLTDEQKEVLPIYLNLSVRLQEGFGLRREEAAKFNVSKAEYKDHINLLPSWTKGGRARIIPIVNEAQRELLNEIRDYAPNRSLIPAHQSYRQYLSHRKHLLAGAQIPGTHGLRHHYAQQRYIQLTGGMLPPRLGGRMHSKLNDKEKVLDIQARLIVSSELGHSRIDITRTYLG